MEPFIIDGFLVEREIGTGVTGSVYLATAQNGLKVALKILVKGKHDYTKLH